MGIAGKVNQAVHNDSINVPALESALAIADRADLDFTTRAVLRDLAWLLFAPDTLTADIPRLGEYTWPSQWREEHVGNWLQRLAQLVLQPVPLMQAIEPIPRRLGLYAEALMDFWMENDPAIDVVFRHQTVSENKRTVGDFDLVLRTRQEGLIHMELAVKFFLGLPGATGLDHWIGTTLDDSLAIKWRRVIDHQLQLSHHPSARELLPNGVSQRWCWFKAWMFYPITYELVPQAFFSRDHCRGVWGNAEALLAHWTPDADVQWMPLLQRLAPALLPRDATPLRLHEAIAQWRQQEVPHARVLARFGYKAGAWREIERAYLVPDDWLLRATAKGLLP